MVKWFGPSWGAPVCDPARHIDTPVGRPCFYCYEGIREGDQGIAMPYFDDEGRASVVPIGLDCFLRDIGVPLQGAQGEDDQPAEPGRP